MKLLSDQVDEKEIRVILRELEKTRAISGDVVEFGCFVGTTSVFLAKKVQQWGDRQLWLYDSFEGLPDKSVEDKNSLGESFKKGELAATKKQLIANFKKANLKLPNITKAWFGDLLPHQVPDKVSFAFLDGDFYQSILDPLELIWDKLTQGAIVVVDDYGNHALPGAQKAVDQWCARHKVKLRVESSLAIFHK